MLSGRGSPNNGLTIPLMRVLGEARYLDLDTSPRATIAGPSQLRGTNKVGGYTTDFTNLEHAARAAVLAPLQRLSSRQGSGLVGGTWAHAWPDRYWTENTMLEPQAAAVAPSSAIKCIDCET